MPRILIVDDESAILGLLSRAFSRAGFEVTTAMSGEQALAICQTTNFDAVLSDVSMPGIDGHQTVSRIRAHASQNCFSFDVGPSHGMHGSMLCREQVLYMVAKAIYTKRRHSGGDRGTGRVPRVASLHWSNFRSGKCIKNLISVR